MRIRSMNVPLGHPERQAAYAARRREWTDARRTEITAFHEAGAAELRAAGINPAEPKDVAEHMKAMQETVPE